MPSDYLTIVLSFSEGFLLILSPCILPILPIFLASSMAGSKKTAIMMVLGFALTFSLIAYFSRFISVNLGIDLNFLRYFSLALLTILGLILMVPYFENRFSQLFNGLAAWGNRQVQKINSKKYYSGLVIGALLAIIWTPCAGPILAAVIVQTVLQQTTAFSFLVLLAFSLGAALPMLIIAYFGKQCLAVFSHNAIRLRQFLGAIIIFSVGYFIYQEHSFSDYAPISTIKTATVLQNGLWRPYKMPALEGTKEWLNSEPLQNKDLTNKVVLINFWTYSCINCIRDQIYLNEWYKKYHSQGLTIIGIHSPEFSFEKSLENVKTALKRLAITYPVTLDNNFTIWQNFNNHYWPAHYLVDKDGFVVYQHFGEGNYAEIENNIRYLLNTNKIQRYTSLVDSFSTDITPEIYLGYARANVALSPKLQTNKIFDYKGSENPAINAWSLSGFWQVLTDKIVAKQQKSSIKLHFYARKVFAVMGSSTGKPINVTVSINNLSTNILVSSYKLYQIAELAKSEEKILELQNELAGLEIFTFTFGN